MFGKRFHVWIAPKKATFVAHTQNGVIFEPLSLSYFTLFIIAGSLSQMGRYSSVKNKYTKTFYTKWPLSIDAKKGKKGQLLSDAK